MATVESVAEKLLEYFKDFNVGPGHYLPHGSVRGKMDSGASKLNPQERALVEKAWEHLLHEGMVERHPERDLGFFLTEKGADHLYE